MKHHKTRGALALILLTASLNFWPGYLRAEEVVTKGVEAENTPKESIDASAAAKNDEESLLMDIDYRDVDIKEVARAFSAISGMNIIVSSEARANVTLKMSNVDWRTALEVILDTYNLSYIERGSFIIITTVERRRQQEESGPLETRIIRLNFANVSNVSATLTSTLSSRGRIDVDARTNSLIVTDIKSNLERVEDVASQLDTRTPQVLIETLVVDVKLTEAFKWGVVETLANHIRSEYDTDGETSKWDKAHKWTGSTSSNLAVSGGSTFNWSKTIFKSLDLNATLQSIFTETESNILANPRVVTLDNLPASIDIVTQEPYQELGETSGGSTLTSTAFTDIGITLTVTPHITKDNYISMEVSTTHSVKTGTSGGVPVVDKRTASTNVLVKDGETVVMGGLRRRDKSNTASKIPILGDIPLLGNLFRSKDTSTTETELVIFITPHLIGDYLLSDNEKIQLDQMRDLRDLTADVISFKNKQLLPLRPPVMSSK